jgi:Mg2+ and Co2+ transporter CorA
MVGYITSDNATSIAQEQSEQISRLTVVTVIFLPITFLTGLYAMNFTWMINHIGSRSLLVLGMLLPVLSVCITVALFMRRGLRFIKRRPLATRRDFRETQSKPEKKPNFGPIQ